jgi:flagellar secretion chaperone FliS
MLPNPYQQYRSTKVGTASPVDLVVMLYQGVVRFTRQGIEAIEQGDVQAAHKGFTRAQDIIAELVGTLDHDRGGEVAKQLLTLYDYAFRRLVEANCKKDIVPAREVIRIFRDLGMAWQELAARQRQTAAPTPAAPARQLLAAV